MDGPTSAVQYQKVDVAILFQPPPISSVLWPRSICTAVWKYALFEIRNTNFSLAARFRVDVRDENVGGREEGRGDSLRETVWNNVVGGVIKRRVSFSLI